MANLTPSGQRRWQLLRMWFYVLAAGIAGIIVFLILLIGFNRPYTVANIVSGYSPAMNGKVVQVRGKVFRLFSLSDKLPSRKGVYLRERVGEVIYSVHTEDFIPVPSHLATGDVVVLEGEIQGRYDFTGTQFGEDGVVLALKNSRIR